MTSIPKFKLLYTDNLPVKWPIIWLDQCSCCLFINLILELWNVGLILTQSFRKLGNITLDFNIHYIQYDMTFLPVWILKACSISLYQPLFLNIYKKNCIPSRKVKQVWKRMRDEFLAKLFLYGFIGLLGTRAVPGPNKFY